MMIWQQCSDENNANNDANYVHDSSDGGNEDVQTTSVLTATVAMMIENVKICESRGENGQHVD